MPFNGTFTEDQFIWKRGTNNNTQADMNFERCVFSSIFSNDNTKFL